MTTTLARFLLSVLAPLLWTPTAQGYQMPGGFVPPAGFTLDERASKAYDFNHKQIVYPEKGASANEHIDPEGKTWLVFMKVTPANKTADATDSAMRAALAAQEWELLTPSGLLIARRQRGGKEQWFSGSAESGYYRATIIEAGPPPHALSLSPPAAMPEVFGNADDFPYLAKFPGATLKRTSVNPGGTIDASPPGTKEFLVGPPVVEKTYELPASTSTYEFMIVYRDALAKAGWKVLRTAASSDALVVAHYAKNGRDVFAYLHDGRFMVADVGATNEARKLADSLAQSGHVAVYGIYFDIDKAVLKPESETALEHVLALLKSDPALKLEVQGHTDNTGIAAHNQTLSNERAASVKVWLVEHGIADSRLTAKGLGDTEPVADNQTPSGRARNRRVELKR